MKITKRDLEALIKKDFRFENQRVYMDNIPICFDTMNGALIITCEQWLDFLKVFLRGKKHIRFYKDCLEIKHPLIYFEKVSIDEDEIEITLK